MVFVEIENTRLKQIIKQNRTTNDPSHSSVSPQRHIPLPINGHSNEDDSTDSVNLDQTQDTSSIESEQMPIDQDISEAPINQAQDKSIAVEA
ncbi:15052_t:CDS:2 [Entrophospora sp. SA101]|nr:15052_t:CDS:2 [Entrophospora sp. SA101]